MNAQVTGSFRSIFLYDLCEEIRLETLRSLLGSPPVGREPLFRNLAPEYVRFEHPPVVETLPPDCRVHYYDYGVVGIEFDHHFDCTWAQLLDASHQWISSPETERRAADLVASIFKRIAPALVRPYDYRLSEDYYIFHLQPLVAADGSIMTATQFIANYGPGIACIVRGEPVPLSKEEELEVLQSRLSYYPADLLVAGWSAALVYDTSEGAAATLQLLEYANSQLLEFRHYDHVLSERLRLVYDTLSAGTGIFSRWRMAREAERLSAMRLEVRELTERVDNAIKFLSDTFSARVYRLAAARIGVPDYRKLVEEKLNTVGELYQFMMDRFQQGRAFALELMVVVILMIELGFLFGGRR